MPDITISEGSTLEVDYEVENAGDGDGDQDILLEVQNALEDTDANVSLAPGGTATGTLAWPTQDGDAVTNAVAEVVSDDSTDGITVDVEAAIIEAIESWNDDNAWTYTNLSSGDTSISGDRFVSADSNSTALKINNGSTNTINHGRNSGEFTSAMEWTLPETAEYTTVEWWYNENGQGQGGVGFWCLDENGNRVFAVGSTNTEAVYYDGGEQQSGQTGGTQNWNHFTVTVDWANDEWSLNWNDGSWTVANISFNQSASNIATVVWGAWGANMNGKFDHFQDDIQALDG